MLNIAVLVMAMLTSNVEDRVARYVETMILPQSWSKVKRALFAKQIVKRVYVESKRRGLDPIAMVAVGWNESHFQPWANGKGNGRRHGEVGPWQLIPYDTYVVIANDMMMGCKLGPKISPRLQVWWEKSYKGKPCEDQEVADARDSIGSWKWNELRDPVVSTYIAAFEIAEHIKKHGSKGFKEYPACKGLPPALWQYGHFNRPAKPQRYYVERLCSRYRKIHKYLSEETLVGRK